tara:strand:- start:62 stop:268 length:207 start_codon:yes stop_codon:yes gene_type:complete
MYQPYELPQEIKEKIRKFQKLYNLSYGAYDFIVIPDGQYVFLENNPSGQWLWLERALNIPISRAVAGR